MSKKWTGQEIFLLGAAVCTLCLMYITILFPGSNIDNQLVDGIEDTQQYQLVDNEEGDELPTHSSTGEKYAYKYQNGEVKHEETNK